ncbi:MAG TPA: CBS domain-containing protein [Acidobacteriota bacterium]|nr:CBS domain-containing protein [Acidobacteriota bacterium]
MKISAIAQSPPPTCKTTAMVDEAVQVMQNARGGAVVVVDDGRVKGIFTERDVLLRVVAANKDPEATLVREVMTSAVETVHEDTEALRGLERMVSRHIRHLPVVDAKESLVGLVSMRNILLNHFDMLLEKASKQ